MSRLYPCTEHVNKTETSYASVVFKITFFLLLPFLDWRSFIWEVFAYERPIAHGDSTVLPKFQAWRSLLPRDEMQYFILPRDRRSFVEIDIYKQTNAQCLTGSESL